MLDDVLRVFGLKPDDDLKVMKPGQTLEQLSCAVLEKLSPVLRRDRPDLVLVHGDTSTAFLAALAAFYAQIPVGHVEAGLRSYDYRNPFPEEANRRLADDLCALHFAPTGAAKKNLLRENIPARGIFVTGNTVIDALHQVSRQPRPVENSDLRRFLHQTSEDPRLQVVLVTAHRRENFGKPLLDICLAMKRSADALPRLRFVYPVHLNPRVQDVVRASLSRHPQICLLPPLSYPDLCRAIRASSVVLTDSGGLQEEAPSLGKPVLVLREVTERPEAVRAGTAKVVGTDSKRIVSELSRLLLNPGAYRRMARAVNPYGDGRAAERIASAIAFHFGLSRSRPADFRPR
jgi:UDP-N-acetylglucosamine 2-epimerase (non-hydrolysing)